jgi:hypothetical protein
MLWSQKWINRAVKTMGQSDAKINNPATDAGYLRISFRDCTTFRLVPVAQSERGTN